MKNINDLPNLCLRIIFSKLPLRDLLRLDQVCPAWAAIQPSACLMRNELTILIGNEPERLIEESSFTLPYYDELIGSQKLSEFKSDHNQLEFYWLDGRLAQLLTRLLPNITTVCIAIQSIPAIDIGEKSWGIKTILADQLIALLAKWSSQIQTLKLFIHFDDSTAGAEKQIECDLQRLLNTINGCQSLRHLTVKLENNFFNNDEQLSSRRKRTVDLPILTRLEEFCLELPDDRQLSVVADSLVKHGQAAHGLRSLAIGGINSYNIGAIQRYDDKLAAKFTQLPDLGFSEPNRDMAELLTKFHQLKGLSIRIISDVGKIYKFAKLIRPRLKGLVYLHIDFEEEEEEDDDDDDDDSGSDHGDRRQRRRAAEERPQQAVPEMRTPKTIPQLASVKIIKIYAPLSSHDRLSSIQWDRLFPNLEILHYNDGWNECSICEPENEHDNDHDNNNIYDDSESEDNELQDEDEDEDEEEEDYDEKEERKHDKCLKFALQPWKHCAKLHSVYTEDHGCSSDKKISLDELFDRE